MLTAVLVWAAEPIGEGTCGENLTWTLDGEGVLTVSGMGQMDNYNWYGAPWYSHCGNIVAVVFEEGVTSIGSHAFSECDQLRQVSIPGTVTAIGEYAFARSNQLEYVSYENGNIQMGNFVFWDCGKLNTVKLGPSVTAVTTDFLSQFEALETIEVAAENETYTAVDGVLFSADRATLIRYPRGRAGSYTVPNGVADIGVKAFESCGGLTEVTIPEGVTAIGNYAFHNCAELTTVNLPKSLTRIGWCGFSNSPKLVQINLTEGIEGDFQHIFEDCTGLLEKCAQPMEILQDRTYETCIEIPVIHTQYYTFTPAETGYYTFRSEGDRDAVGYLFSADGNVMAEDDDGGKGTNFILGCRLEAGKTYLFGAKLYSSQAIGQFRVEIGRSHEYEAQVETAPTCSADGVLRWRCIDCGDTYTEKIPAGHAYEGGACTRCGREERYMLSADPARNGAVDVTPSHNADRNTYDSYAAAPICSVLIREGDGYLRAEYIDEQIVLEWYDRDYTLYAAKFIPLELPLFGGICIEEDYNFVVCCQPNYEENDDVEVVRIICYSKSWERLGSASLYGGGAALPLRSGSLRFARSEDILYIHTSRKLYKSGDGINHQANMTMYVNINQLASGVDNIEAEQICLGHVSHSFDQFILVDNHRLLTVDLGDANPRAVVLNHWRDAADKACTPYEATRSEFAVLPIAENLGIYQITGVALGAVESSDTHYLVAGNTCAQTGGIDQETAQRNIFVTVTPKDSLSEEATEIIYFTDYTQSDEVEISAPYLVKLGGNRFCLLWAAEDKVHYCMLDGQGQRTSAIFSGEGSLSDCAPIVTECAIVWYVTNDGAPVFYQIDIAHNYEIGQVTEPTCTEQGYTVYTCTACGHVYSADHTNALGHSFTNYVSDGNAACTEDGTKTAVCDRCDVQDTIADIGSTVGHAEVIDSAVPATCTEPGLTEGTHCVVCGLVIAQQDLVPAAGHVWNQWQETKPATNMEPGILDRSCTVCAAVETEEIPRLDYTTGDLDGDGQVTADDAIYLLYHTLFGDVYPVNQACDFDGSGTVDADDAIYLLYYTLFGDALYPLNA